VLTFEAPWTTRNTWGAPHNFFRHPHGLISDRVEGGGGVVGGWGERLYGFPVNLAFFFNTDC